MAKPRVFISSTYYDLKNVRADLERYIRERGYEPVRNERGQIAYGTEEKLEEYCYKEVELCDILLAIIGGRYGTESDHGAYSISQKELKTALDLGKPVYIFVEKDVLSEHRTYQRNKSVKNFQCVAVDDKRVYEFLDEVVALPMNNPIAPFETSADIIAYLQEQWAALFQRMLQGAARQKEVLLIEDMKSMTATLKQLVTFLASEKTKGEQAVRDILLINHPMFVQLRKLLKVPYRVFFTSLSEFNIWIEQRSFAQVEEKMWDSPKEKEWVKRVRTRQTLLKIHIKVFDEEGRLRSYTPEEWDSNLVKVEETEVKEDASSDDVPF